MAATREPPQASAGTQYEKLKPGPGRHGSVVADSQRTRIQAAMVEIVARHGYGSVKVRELVRVAGVSSRAFYERFDSKEDCFLRTHEMVLQGGTRGLISSQADENDWQQRPRLIYGGFARWMKQEPDAAHLALVDAYAGRSVALEQARRAEATFAGIVGESFARAPDGMEVPALLVEGMMAGIVGVSRTRLLEGRVAEMGVGGELMDWAMSFPSVSTASLAGLDVGTVWRNSALKAQAEVDIKEIDVGDRASILSAVAKLAVDGYSNLTVSRIRIGAGISRKTFNANFDGVEECFLVAVEQRAAEAVANAARAQAAGRTWSGGVYRAISSLCDQIAADPLLAGVCFADDFPVGSKGSRARLRLVTGVAQQLRDSAPLDLRASDLVAEASAGAVWGLFHKHVLRTLIQQRPQIAATLGYLALTPAIGSAAAIVAISDEQSA
jgi:AcrR family transcriptional regulator